MNYYLKLGGFIILGYLCIWLMFMIIALFKLYFGEYVYSYLISFSKN